MPEVVLVVEDDADIARILCWTLEKAGYEVDVAVDGEEALEKAAAVKPGLVLLDVTMPKMDGFEVAKRLRSGSHTSNVSIIMLTARAHSSDRVRGLESGADDYMIKPFDPTELLARVRGALRRAKDMRDLSPLTGLPGNIKIQEEIERKVHASAPLAVLYCDLDNFKTFNDQKGFVTGDRMLQTAARVIDEAASTLGLVEAFIGHIGGDDFVAMVPPDDAEELARLICELFESAKSDFYEAQELERGSVLMEDRQGVMREFPLVAISIGIASSAKRDFQHYGEAVALATEMKGVAKRDQGSSYAVDRRTR